jgi:NAD+ synthase
LLVRDVLSIDAERTATEIEAEIRRQVLGDFRRRGAVVGLSGGIDSSVTAALCVRALGADRVLGLLMPETDSSDDALRLGRLVAGALGIEHVVEDIAPVLAALGCYDRQHEAIREVFPEYADGWRCKVVMPSVLDDRLQVPSLTVADPTGGETTRRMPPGAYQQLVAATGFKQRTRAMLEYYHADRLHHAVAGTPNRLEYELGFFVKGGDGAADIKPIAHLYKTQVWTLAEHLGIPAEIVGRPPTTDTFSLPQSQEEFYFTLPLRDMDMCLWAWHHGIDPEEVAPTIGATPQQIARVYRDIEAKIRVSRYLHHRPKPFEQDA